MKRYWVSWWTGDYEDEGCTTPPFQFWITGQRDRENHGLNDAEYRRLSEIENEDEYDSFLNENARDDCSICAVIDAENTEDIWYAIQKYFPDFEMRFCDEQESDFTPGDRFQGFENRTLIHGG
jgi:hypothetical protein